MNSNTARRRTWLASFALVAGAALGVVGATAAPHIARAHTDFDYSLPADGASVGEPVEEITVAFTQPVTLVGNGFEVLTPQGEVVLPFPVTDDDIAFRLQLDSPLGGGEVGVRYEVTSPDGHVVSGGFAFTVAVPAPTAPATTAPATTAPTTAVPATAVPATSAPATSAPATAVPATTAPATTAPATTAAAVPSSTVAAVGAAAGSGDDGGGPSTGVYVAIAVAVAAGAGAFVLLRLRRPAPA